MFDLEDKLNEYKGDLNAQYFYNLLKEVGNQKVFWKNFTYYVKKTKNDYLICNSMTDHAIGFLDDNGDLLDGWEYWDFISEDKLSKLQKEGRTWDSMKISMMKFELSVLRAGKVATQILRDVTLNGR